MDIAIVVERGALVRRLELQEALAFDEGEHEVAFDQDSEAGGGMGIDDFDDAGEDAGEGGDGEADGDGVFVGADLFEAFKIGQAADGDGRVLQGTVGFFATEGEEVGAEDSQ